MSKRNILLTDVADLLTSDMCKDAQYTRQLLANICDQLEYIDAIEHDNKIMQSLMQIVFADLESKATDVVRFRALRQAGLEIAANLDKQDSLLRPAFHNRGHFLFVQVCGRVIDKINQVYCQVSNNIPSLSAEELACSALIDLVHDMGHTGGINTIDGVYTPMKAEKQSFLTALPYFKSNHLPPTDIERIRLAVMASDPYVPKEIMRYNYKRHFPENALEVTRPLALDMHLLLDNIKGYDDYDFLDTGLANDITATFLAARLGDADLLPSFGLNTERTTKETSKLNIEFLNNGQSPLCDSHSFLPKPRLYALLKILGGRRNFESGKIDVGFCTPAAQWLSGDIAHSFQLNTQDILGPTETKNFYKAVGISYQIP